MIDQVRTGTTPRLNTARAAASPAAVAEHRSQVTPASGAKETGEEQRSLGQWHHGGGRDLPSFDETSAEQHDDLDASADGFVGVMDESAEPENEDVTAPLPREEEVAAGSEARPMPRSVADGLKRLMEEARRGAFTQAADPAKSGNETPPALRSAGLFVKAADAYGLQGELRGEGAGLRPGMVFSSKF